MTDTFAPAPEGTRLALIDAGLEMFGRQGFAATSTRMLSARAGTNIASIAYHFGGKEGLRLACAEEVARRMTAVFAAPGQLPTTADAARAVMHRLIERMVGYVVVGEQAGTMVPFVLRELTEGGPALNVIYGHLIAPVHAQLCNLWAVATGERAEADRIKLVVFSLIGQVVYFRLGARVVTRRMGWQTISASEAREIIAMLADNLDRLLGPMPKARP